VQDGRRGDDSFGVKRGTTNVPRKAVHDQEKTKMAPDNSRRLGDGEEKKFGNRRLCRPEGKEGTSRALKAQRREKGVTLRLTGEKRTEKGQDD